jgi:hypothetical protein
VAYHGRTTGGEGAAAPGTGGIGRHTGRRRWPMAAAAVAALTTLAVAGCGASSSPLSGPAPLQAIPRASVIAGETRGTGSRSGVTGGALFGGNGSLVPVEPLLGRRLAIVREYYGVGESFPNPTDSHIMASGSTLMVSLDTNPGGPTYASIAAGYEDGTILAFLEAMNRAAIRYHLAAIYFCFEHEADVQAHHYGLGSPAQFVQAWDHLHQLAQSAHLNWTDGGRIHWVWILSHEAFVPIAQRTAGARQEGIASEYWPGSNEVDVVGADGYEGHGCPRQPPGEVRTAGTLFGPVISFAHQHGGLPVFITEWGATAYPTPQWQALFIRQMQAFVTVNPEIAAALYWNSSGHHPHCDFSINANPVSIAAMSTMGSSRGLQGRVG